jgi:hypothetical protein
MARLRQLHPQNYPNSGNINTEFESLIRYLNAAELGNKTLAELLGVLFDGDGEFDGPIDMRLDTSAGLQYRVGEYEEEDDGWTTIAAISELRGPAGQNLGTVEGPFFFNRQDYVATAGQTDLPYNIDTNTEEVVVFKNGLLQAPTAYTVDDLNNEIVMSSALALNDKVTIYSVRASSVTGYVRVDITAAASQAVFPFIHTEDQRILVYRNGLLQREGGAYDYVASPASDTVTFTTALPGGDIVTIMTVENQALTNVAGLMLEDEYTENGLINWSKIGVEDDEIAQIKVAGLVAALASKGKLTVSATAPVGPAIGDHWQDTSQTPDVLKFWDGTSWISTSPASSLPSFIGSNAGQYVRVNALGTALEYGNIDNSALVPKTYMGAANGVASLDSAGKLPTSQLPSVFALGNVGYIGAGAVANGTKTVQRIYGSKVRLTGWGYKLGAGTCTIQLAVDGVVIGTTQAVTTAAGQGNFGSIIEIDATTATRVIQISVTSATSASDLEVGLATQVLST